MNIDQYFASLGSTPDEVAEVLRKQAVKGKKLDCRLCPILNGLYQACPNYWPGLIIVNGSRREDGHWIYTATLRDPQILNPRLPQAVMDFIGFFDNGCYPDLEAKTVEIKRVWS